MTARALRCGDATVALELGDITTVRADALVNAANAALAGGGGVDGAIHDAGGPEIEAACRRLPWVGPGVKCPPGEVRTTTAGALAATWLIHAVGPIYDNRDPAGSAATLDQVVRAVRSAARVALAAVFDELPALSLRRVTFVLFTAVDLRAFEDALDGVARGERA